MTKPLVVVQDLKGNTIATIDVTKCRILQGTIVVNGYPFVPQQTDALERCLTSAQRIQGVIHSFDPESKQAFSGYISGLSRGKRIISVTITT